MYPPKIKKGGKRDGRGREDSEESGCQGDRIIKCTDSEANCPGTNPASSV